MPSAQNFSPSSFPLDRPTPFPDNFFREGFGGTLICCMLTLILYGLSVLQTYLYYLNYPDDRRVLKILVTVLFSMSTLHAIFACSSVYHYLIITYHDPLSLISGHWPLYAAPVTGVFICFLVQLFYTRMIYYLTNHTWRLLLTIILVLLILMQLGFGILTNVRTFLEWDIVNLSNIALNSMVPMIVARVTSDMVTALSLCICLRRAQQVDVAGSAKLIHALIIFSVNRFLLTTVVVAVQMIVLIYSPTSTWALPMDLVSVHLYVNSCLATLNSRNHMRGIGQTGIEQSDFLTSGHGIEFERPQTVTTSRDRRSVNVELNRTRTTEEVGIDMVDSVKDHNISQSAVRTQR